MARSGQRGPGPGGDQRRGRLDPRAIRPGMPVYDNNNVAVGRVVGIGPAHLLVDLVAAPGTGVQVPHHAVAALDRRGMHLGVSADLIPMMGWEVVRAGEPPPGPGQRPPGAVEITPRSARDDLAEAPAGAPEESEAAPADEPIRIARHEEQLHTETSVRDAGRVRVRKETAEQEERRQVPVVHEELRGERRRVDRPLGDDRAVSSEGDRTVVLVLEERLEVRKVPWVVEEIEITKVRREEVQEVSAVLRKERLSIDLEGDLELERPSE